MNEAHRISPVVKRSGSLPLSISFSMGNSPSEQSHIITDTDPTMESIFRFVAEILLENSGRIKELSFTGSAIPHMAALLHQLASCCFPILKVFRICHTGFLRYRQESVLPFHSLVQQMPALNSLAMVGFDHDSRHFAQLELSWENLTELLLPPWPTGQSVFSSKEILGILGHAHRLQSLAISVDISTWSTITAVLNLPSTREMRLHYYYYGRETEARSCLQNFCQSMVCRSLKTLYALWHGTSDLKEDMPFSAFLSLEELEALSLDMPLTSRTLIESLALNPKLKFLEILNQGFVVDDGIMCCDDIAVLYTVDDSVLSSLSLMNQKGNHILCPDLQRVRIIYKGADVPRPRITNSSLLIFLETRVHQTKLQSCDIFYRFPQAHPMEDENRGFQRLVNSGLKLRIRYGRLASPRTSESFPDTPKEGLLDLNGSNLSDMEGYHGTGVIV